MPRVKHINSVLYGWLEGRSKFLLFLTPSLILSLAFPLRTQATGGVFEGHKRTHTETHTQATSRALRNPPYQGKSGEAVPELKAHIFFLLSFSLLSIFLSFPVFPLAIKILDAGLESVQ